MKTADPTSGEPAVDLYDDLLTTVRGDLAAADGTAELAAAVRSLLAEVRVGLDDGLLRIESRLWSKPDRTPSSMVPFGALALPPLTVALA